MAPTAYPIRPTMISVNGAHAVQPESRSNSPMPTPPAIAPLFLPKIMAQIKRGTFPRWTAWAPFTLIIVGLMGYAVGAITEKHHGFGWNKLAIAVACVIKVAGYYIAEGIIYGNWIAPVTSIPGNLVQIGVAAVIVLLIVGQLQKIVNKML